MASYQERRRKILGYVVVAGLLTCATATQAERLTLPAEPIAPKSRQECFQLRKEYNLLRMGLSQQHTACFKSAVDKGWYAGRNVGEGGCATFYVEPCYGIVQMCDQVQASGEAAVERCMEKAAFNEEKEKQALADARARDALQERNNDLLRSQQQSLERQRTQRDADQRAADAARQARSAEIQRNEEQARQQKWELKKNVVGSVISSLLDLSSRRATERAEAAQREREEERRAEGKRMLDAREDTARRDSQKLEEARKAEAKRLQESLWQKMVGEVSQDKNIVEKGQYILDADKNPFTGRVNRPVTTAAVDVAGEEVGKWAVRKGIDSLGIGPDTGNATYDTVATVVGEGRGVALGSNPVASQFSGIAAEGVDSVNRRVLGQLDVLAANMEAVSANSSTSSGAAPKGPLRVTPLPVGGSSGANPFARKNSTDNRQGTIDVAVVDNVRPPTDTAYPTQEQLPAPRSNAPPQGTSGEYVHNDPSTGQRLLIPAGHVLYRDPRTRQLSVVTTGSISTLEGDREGKCSDTGLGAVTPTCEDVRRKAKNPFSKR